MTTGLSSSRSRLWKPEELLFELAVREPQDINLELIAERCGARVRYVTLSGCAAKLVGFGNDAIILVDSSSHFYRQRFSIGHELGHWMHDRGRAGFSCGPRTLTEEWTSMNPEARANRFASKLLMPEDLFKEMAARLKPGFGAIRSLAKTFRTSVTAAAIRFVELSSDRHFLLCACRKGRRSWFVRSPRLSPRLFPLDWPVSASVTQVVRGREPFPAETVEGNVWFDSGSARQRTVLEETIQNGRYGQETLSLLSWPQVRRGDTDEE